MSTVISVRAAVAVAAATSLLAVGSTAAASKRGGWVVEPTVRFGSSSWFDAVSCPQAAVCMAVGIRGSGPLAERWNGARWTDVPVPRRGESELGSVSCSSADHCTALSAGPVMKAEQWNGVRWSVQSMPRLAATLDAVSCPVTSFCTAVGFYGASGGRLLAERWNGTRWAVQPVTVNFPHPDAGLYGVSCVSATSCTAVGSYQPKRDDTQPLAATWDGTTWRARRVPHPAGEANYAELDAVSCAAAASCTAVGADGSAKAGGLFSEQRRGARWTARRMPVPVPAQASNGFDAYAVSCGTATSCTAVGTYFPGVSFTPSVTLAEHWNGTRWMIQKTPGVSPYAWHAELSGVSCTAALCTAVGAWQDDPPGGRISVRPLAERN
jgi:hypothetical protein